MKIKGYAVHFDRPNLNGEVVNERSFKQCLKKYEKIGQYPMLNFNHDSTKPVGAIKSMTTDKEGLFIEAEINEELAREYGIKDLIEDGTIEAFSTEGYYDFDTTKFNDDGTYTANDFHITAVAIVPNPADPQAKFTHNSRKLSFFGKEVEPKHEEKDANNKTTNQLIYLI